MRGIRYEWAMVVLAVVGMVATAGWAEVSTTGDTYDNGMYFYAGYNPNTTGGLAIDAGSVFGSWGGYLGYATGSTGTAIITGTGSQWGSSLYVGNYGSGMLRVEAGGQVHSGNSYMGAFSGSTGEAIVTGAGSEWTNTGEFVVGHNSSGTLRVEAGAQVSSCSCDVGFDHGSAGTAIITGAESKWTNSSELRVGTFGSGTLRVEAGARVSNTYGYLGRYSGSKGTATISGAGSKWANSAALRVGYEGSGTLRVEGGAQVSSTSGTLGEYSGSTGEAIITGAGSTWTNSGILSIGSSGSGTFRVEDGAQVSNATGYLGSWSGSTGTAVISGAGSKWANSGSLYIGSYGSGSVQQSDGTVQAGAVTIREKGSYVLSGGVLEVSTSMELRGAFSWQGGQFSTPALAMFGGTMALSAGGGKLLKVSSLSMANSGVLDLGDNAMILQANASSRGFVLWSVTGGIRNARNTQELWQGAGITSSVAREDGSGLYGLGVILNVDAQGKAIYSVFEGEAVDANSILVKYTLNGDADLNGVVDGSDYFFIDKGFLSKASGYGNGDFDYNGVIDGSDYFLIDKAYLATHAGGGAAGVNAVPEPGALGMVMIAAAVGLGRRRRGR